MKELRILLDFLGQRGALSLLFFFFIMINVFIYNMNLQVKENSNGYGYPHFTLIYEVEHLDKTFKAFDDETLKLFSTIQSINTLVPIILFLFLTGLLYRVFKETAFEKILIIPIIYIVTAYIANHSLVLLKAGLPEINPKLVQLATLFSTLSVVAIGVSLVSLIGGTFIVHKK